MAFLNYARQVIPTLNVSGEIMWKLFPQKVEKCSVWAQYTQAHDQTDFTKSPDCMKYAYSILLWVLQKPSTVKFTSYKVEYFEKVIGSLLNEAALEQMSTLLPDKVRPYKDQMEETRPMLDRQREQHLAMQKAEKAAAKKNAKKRLLERSRVLMSETEKKKLEIAEQRMSEGKKVRVNLSAEPKWRFIISQNKNDGILLGKYGNGGVKDLGIRGFLNEDDSGMDLGELLKNLAGERSKRDKEIPVPAEKK